MRISTDHWVLGVTLVDNELFVLLGRDNWQDKNQVAVYSINDYRRLRHLTVPGYRPDINCYITSCVQRKCLYMSDGEKQVIHRYDLRGGRMKRIVGSHVTSFPVPGTPSGMSVKADGNLVVTCPRLSGAKLVELAVDRIVCLREIELHSDIGCPWHAVQLTDSQFVVCHGGFYRLHRVCAVDADGNVTRSYGGQPGSDVGQLNNPCHLAVDKDTQFIFVADRNNNRVVLLSPTLEFVRYVSQGLSQPSRLYFHQSTRCLYVGQKSGEKGGAISVI